jgi:hypothetical protein
MIDVIESPLDAAGFFLKEGLAQSGNNLRIY